MHVVSSEIIYIFSRNRMDYEDNEEGQLNVFQRQGSMESEFICGCCSDLLIQPTTLTCGHSFCRLCLAQWFTQSRKRTCPFCQQAYLGCPGVNITIKCVLKCFLKFFLLFIKIRLKIQKLVAAS